MGRAARADASAASRRLLALAWTGIGTPALGAMLAVGAVVWLAYALLWLGLHGPALDESAIAAPLITGDAGYPAGHPNMVADRRAMLLFYQLAALQWAVHPDPWWISAGRNVLFLFLSAFVPFALVTICTRRPMWGHVAAALTLSETVCSAVGVYLMWVFPGVYSTGHLGIHLALLATVLVAARFDRLGGFLVGLVPAVHATMAAVVLPAVAVVLFQRRGDGEPMRRVLASAAVGLAITALVAASVAWRTAGDVAAPPYDSRGEGTAIIRTFIRTTDPHRQPLPLRSPIGLVGPIAFAALATMVAVTGRRPLRDRRACEGIVLAGAIAWAWVLGTRLLQAVMSEVPLAILVAMPARFANLAMLALVPLAVIVLATSAPPRTATVIAAALVVVEAVLLVTARHAAFVHLLYVTLGVALGAAAGRGRVLAIGAGVAVFGACALVRAADGSPVVWSFVAGFVVAAAVSRLVPAARHVRPALGGLVAVACAAVALIAVPGPHAASVWDFGSERQTPEETALADWLRAHAPPKAMLLAPPFPPAWLQPKTGHPVLFDMITLLSLTYFPQVAEPEARLVRDVFGVDYTDPAAVDPLRGPDGMLRPSSPVWLRAWAERSCAGWRELAARWDVAYVLSPHATRLRLPDVWSGPTWTLYEIPRDPAACAARDGAS